MPLLQYCCRTITGCFYKKRRKKRVLSQTERCRSNLSTNAKRHFAVFWFSFVDIFIFVKFCFICLDNLNCFYYNNFACLFLNNKKIRKMLWKLNIKTPFYYLTVLHLLKPPNPKFPKTKTFCEPLHSGYLEQLLNKPYLPCFIIILAPHSGHKTL